MKSNYVVERFLMIIIANNKAYPILRVYLLLYKICTLS